MIGIGEDVYRLIDHLSSYGTMTTQDIAKKVVVAEWVVANYLAEKRGLTGGGVVVPHPDADKEGGKVRSHAGALQDARKKDREKRESEITAREERAVERNARRVELRRRRERMNRIMAFIQIAQNYPEHYIGKHNKLAGYNDRTASATKIRTLAGVLNARAAAGWSDKALAKWTDRHWMSYALDAHPELVNWQVAAIGKYARRLTEARLKFAPRPIAEQHLEAAE